MKKIVKVILSCLMVCVLSCEDEFLNLEHPSAITEDTYFNEPEHFKLSANDFYSQMNRYGDSYFYDYGTDLTAYPDVGTQHEYGRGVVNPEVSDSYFSNSYTYIRRNNLLLERAEAYGGDQNEIAEYVAVAKFFRAWNYYFLVQRYGGVPIVLRSLDLGDEELLGKRSSRYQVVAQVLKDLDEAIPDLLEEQNIASNDKGKISKWAAMAFKARVLLHEATWMKYVGTSTDGDGVSSGAGSEGYDPNNIDLYLQEAIELSKAVIDYGGYELWNHNSELDNMSSFYLFNLEDETSNPAGLGKTTNNEFILYSKYDADLSPGASVTHGVRGRLQPSRKMMDMFLCLDGQTINKSSSFKGYVKTSDEYQNRDFRMRAYFADYFTYEIPEDGSIVLNSALVSGYKNQKFGAYNYDDGNSGVQSPDYAHIRLAEVYLMYAEALYELNGSLTDEQMAESINKVKARAGLLPITNAILAENGMDIGEEIRRERTIELYGEYSRYIDLKRWGVAEEELGESILGAVIEGTDYETNPSLYVPSAYAFGEETTETGKGDLRAVVIENASNRNFQRMHYLYPLPTGEITRDGSEMLQNPGY